MKNYLFFILLSIALFIGGCNSDEVIDAKKDTITFETADVSRTEISGVHTTWNDGDPVGVFCDKTSPALNNEQAGISVSGSAGYFTVSSNWGSTDPHTFYAYYPYNAASTSPADTKVVIPAEQTGKESDLGDYQFIYAKSDPQNSPCIVPMQFKQLFSVIRFVLPQRESTSTHHKAIKIHAAADQLSGTFSVNLDNGDVNLEKSEHCIDINCDIDLDDPDENNRSVFMYCKTENVKDMEIYVTFDDTETSGEIAKINKVWNPGLDKTIKGKITLSYAENITLYYLVGEVAVDTENDMLYIPAYGNNTNAMFYYGSTAALTTDYATSLQTGVQGLLYQTANISTTGPISVTKKAYLWVQAAHNDDNIQMYLGTTSNIEEQHTFENVTTKNIGDVCKLVGLTQAEIAAGKISNGKYRFPTNAELQFLVNNTDKVGTVWQTHCFAEKLWVSRVGWYDSHAYVREPDITNQTWCYSDTDASRLKRYYNSTSTCNIAPVSYQTNAFVVRCVYIH